MSLFDEPVKAHLDLDPILWVGSEVLADKVMAITVSGSGRVGLTEIHHLRVDWRWVNDRSPYRAGAEGPGWVDLDEIETQSADLKEQVEGLKRAVVQELGGTQRELVEGRDYIVGSDGTKFDPSTNRPIDE